MRSCVAGIGGCGGNLLAVFLADADIIKPLSKITNAEHVAFGGIKGVWIEADRNALNKLTFFKDLNDGYPGYIIPHDSIKPNSKTHSLVMNKYGYDIKKQGFFREAQYLKAIFEIFDNDMEVKETAKNEFGDENPILESAWNALRGFITLGEGDCDNILFVVSLGGGTGTGFINPVLRYIRAGGSRDYPVFVLGVLTEQGDESDREQQSKEGQRNLGATISMYDLLTKSARDGVDGLILIDNQLLAERFGQDYTQINEYIFCVMKPILADRAFPNENPPALALAELFTNNLPRPPVLVPCYASLNDKQSKNKEEELVREALKGSISKNSHNGWLFPCDPERADMAFVFARGYLSAEKIESAVEAEIGIRANDIFTWRKLGENRDNEILILLRNPYGSGCGPFEKRMYRVISLGLKYFEANKNKLLCRDHVEDKDLHPTSLTTEALEIYFNKLEKELRDAMKRLKNGEKPLFWRELRIFDSSPSKKSDNNINKNNLEALDEESMRKIVRDIVREELEKYQVKAA